MHSEFSVALPAWLVARLQSVVEPLHTHEDRMALAIELSAENIKRGTGGPFGCIIVEESRGVLVSGGVNLVTGSQLSISHAEMVAISMLQTKLNDWDVAGHGRYQLVSSCEPCAMCFGAIPWSGVSSLLCGAAKKDAEAVGFDEGPKPEQWAQALVQRGIDVTTGILHLQAAQVLKDYADLGGTVYNNRL